jgi:hypothetical protein
MFYPILAQRLAINQLVVPNSDLLSKNFRSYYYFVIMITRRKICWGYVVVNEDMAYFLDQRVLKHERWTVQVHDEGGDMRVICM